MANENKRFNTDDDIVKKIANMIQLSTITENAVGAIDGRNKSFSSSVRFSNTSLKVYVNGAITLGYTITSQNSIELNTAPPIGQSVILSYVPYDFSG